MALELSRITPDDAVAALASYPRRFRALLVPLDDDDRPEDRWQQVGADGRSALDHVRTAGQRIAVAGRALARITTVDRPMVPQVLVDPSAPAGRAPGGAGAGDAPSEARTVQAALDHLSLECQALSAAAGALGIDDWNRVGVVEGSQRTVTALDVVREAVRSGHDALRAAQRAIEAAGS